MGAKKVTPKKTEDLELITEMKLGNPEAERALFDRYRFHCLKLAKEYYDVNYGSGITFSEFYSVCLTSIFFAAKCYDGSRSYFYPYWRKIANNQLATYIQQNSYHFKARMFAGVSLDSFTGKDETIPVSETIGYSEPIYEVEEDAGTFEHFIEKITPQLVDPFTQEELLVMKLLSNGKDNDAIIRKTGFSKDHLYYLRKRIKTKLTKVIYQD